MLLDRLRCQLNRASSWTKKEGHQVPEAELNAVNQCMRTSDTRERGRHERFRSCWSVSLMREERGLKERSWKARFACRRRVEGCMMMMIMIRKNTWMAKGDRLSSNRLHQLGAMIVLPSVSG